eukprot:g27903.t1
MGSSPTKMDNRIRVVFVLLTMPFMATVAFSFQARLPSFPKFQGHFPSFSKPTFTKTSLPFQGKLLEKFGELRNRRVARITPQDAAEIHAALMNTRNVQKGFRPSDCGGCWCVNGSAPCPDWEPQNYWSKGTIAAFANQVALNPYQLDCNPYEQDCSTTPEQTGTDWPDAVCGVVYHDSDLCGTYTLQTYRSAGEAQRAGATVTHLSACGVCSTLQDLSVYIKLPDLTTAGKKCAMIGQVSYSYGLQCWKDLGFTLPCAMMYNYNAQYDIENCWLKCMANLFTPNNAPAPGCELNSCLECDEDLAGPVFKKVAGRTRRGSGLESAIARPCESVARLEHTPCPHMRYRMASVAGIEQLPALPSHRAGGGKLHWLAGMLAAFACWMKLQGRWVPGKYFLLLHPARSRLSQRWKKASSCMRLGKQRGSPAPTPRPVDTPRDDDLASPLSFPDCSELTRPLLPTSKKRWFAANNMLCPIEERDRQEPEARHPLKKGETLIPQWVGAIGAIYCISGIRAHSPSSDESILSSDDSSSESFKVSSNFDPF